MAIHHRKFLSANESSLYTCSFTDDCGDQYINGYCLRCVQTPPPRPPPVRQKSLEAHVLPYLISAVCALGIAFLILITCTILIRYRFSQRRRRRVLDSAQETVFVDEDHGPIIDHPIWHIVTVGLPQSAIDSITSFKYKRGSDGLIEGTDCSVCLTEFEDGDDLRLLPKCSHAFHLPCIDTWLRSHKNCPLCRAPVNPESPDQARQLGETSQIRDRDRDRAEDNLPIEGVRIAEILKRNRENRMLSDLGENCRIINEDFQQPVRRSISMDASAASAISSAVVYNVAISADEASSKRDKRVTEAEKGAKRVRRDSSMSRLIKSSSIGFSLQKAPVSMKRSLSSTSSNIFSSFRGSKSQSSSVLPL